MQVVDINRGAIMSRVLKVVEIPMDVLHFQKTVSAGGPYFAADSCRRANDRQYS